MSTQTVTDVKLTPEDKKLWVDALRSGDYTQGKNALRNTDTDTYCCLGVLCAVTGRIVNGFGGAYATEHSTDLTNNASVYRDFGELLGRYHDYECHGPEDDDPDYPCEGTGVMDQLTTWNDSDFNHKSFTEIADWIEENL